MTDEKGKAYRALMVTSNNPERYYGWAEGLDYAAATEGDLRAALERSVESFATGANGRARSPKSSGVVAGFERGEGGNYHTHHLLMSAHPIKFDSVQRKFDHSRIEPVRGSLEEAVDYIFKRGRHQDKAATMLCEPVEWGEFRCDNKDAARKGAVFEEIDALLDQGLTPRDVYREGGARLAFYRNAVETAYAARMEAGIPLKRDLNVVYHVGAPGTGKSATYWELVERHGRENVFMASGSNKNMLDRYEYQHTLVLDDLRGDDMPLNVLLGLLDEYPLLARCRYQDKRLAYTEMHITSVIPPERLYFYTELDSYEQLRRRLTTVVYHWKTTSDGVASYRQLSVPAAEYEGYYKLRCLALGLDAPHEA